MALSAAGPAGASNPQTGAQPLSWTDWADLALSSPVVLRVETAQVRRLGRRLAPDVPPGAVRALVQANLVSALKAPAILPAGAEWMWQGAADARGRPPFAKGQPLLVFAAPVTGSPRPEVQQLQLSGPLAQQPWSAASEARVRAILVAALKPGATGLMVTGVLDGFRSEGTVEGASESQFFLATEGGQPMTLLVTRLPDAPPLVRAASGDLVDRAVEIQPQTLLWRALACGLPATLPERLAESPGLVADFALARRSLGACGRSLP